MYSHYLAYTETGIILINVYVIGLQWKAPELLRDPFSPSRGTQKGDVYSAALILFEILGRCGPWGQTNLTARGNYIFIIVTAVFIIIINELSTTCHATLCAAFGYQRDVIQQMLCILFVGTQLSGSLLHDFIVYLRLTQNYKVHIFASYMGMAIAGRHIARK